MKIYIGADYRGEELKNKCLKYLKSKYEVIDLSGNNNDYPEVAFRVGEATRDDVNSLGIVICGSGHGVCCAANKVHKIRCVRCTTSLDAKLGREHDLANVLALGSDIISNFNDVKDIIDTFIETPVSNLERRIKRTNMIYEYEDKHGY